MLTEERFSRILSFLDRKGSASVQELVDELQTSESTVRRDLSTMDERGLLLKVRGGAMKKPGASAASDQLVSRRSELFVEEKKAIGRYAAALIEPGDFVFLDSGTTTGHLIDYLTVKDAVFVTNSISHVQRLAEKGYRATILGGECKSVTQAIVGSETVAELRNFYFSKGFFGTNGVNARFGFTTPEEQEATVKRTAMGHSAKPYVLADTSKFPEISHVRFAEFEDAQVITAGKMPEGYGQYENIIQV